MSERQAYIDERKNWDFVKLPKSSKDDQGDKITSILTVSILILSFLLLVKQRVGLRLLLLVRVTQS